MNDTSVIISTAQLEDRLDDSRLCLVDLSKAEHFADGHIPGASHLEYAVLLDGGKPAPGRLPARPRLEQLASRLALHEDRFVVACDDEGSGRAARLLWTLHVLGHRNCSVLDGGMTAWKGEGRRLTCESAARTGKSVQLGSLDQGPIATREFILSHLENERVALLDVRTPEEYAGTKRLSARGGHIPGAVNLNWLETIDHDNHMRLKPKGVLARMLTERGIRPAQEVIAYCQTHHRSAHAWMMLKFLGYHSVRGYPGSWSEWGNDPDTPVELDTRKKP